jgi:hypothetical protein
MGFDYLAERNLARSREIQNLIVLQKKDITGAGSHIFVEQQPIDAEFSLSILKSDPNMFQRDGVVVSQTPQHMGLN